MKIVVAMDSLKGSVSSEDANRAIAKGLRLAGGMDIHQVPIADGGEGTVAALVSAHKGTLVHVNVTGPLGKPVKATYGLIKKGTTAVIEIAEACGLPLLKKEELNSMSTTSYGVGELILDAAGKGCTDIIIGLGGSSTTDAGIGMLQALGFQFLTDTGSSAGYGGRSLKHISVIDSSNVHPSLEKVCFHVACDVTNPLHGPNGAAFVFGKQKGAGPQEMASLDEGLKHFSSLASKQLGIDLQSIPGSGAAGGLGAAFTAFLHSPLLPGVDYILTELGLREMLHDADVVITGEGKLDGQSSMGKAPSGVAKLAKQFGSTVIALAGDVSDADKSLHEIGIDAYFSIVPGPVTLEKAMELDSATHNLTRTGEQVGRMLLLSMKTKDYTRSNQHSGGHH
ncbi:glycerate kinase [Rossellomorea sp. NPDC077527]|uniref:glycerate kinase n=1 Tax=Rossellomorea sp. NPDC077527 TaxID=3364510 RepID=UPI0037CA1C33